jgi:hypothetical protein
MHLPADPPLTCLVRVLKSYDAKATLNEPCGKTGNLEFGVCPAIIILLQALTTPPESAEKFRGRDGFAY